MMDPRLRGAEPAGVELLAAGALAAEATPGSNAPMMDPRLRGADPADDALGAEATPGSNAPMMDPRLRGAVVGGIMPEGPAASAACGAMCSTGEKRSWEQV